MINADKTLLALEKQVLEGSFKLFVTNAWKHIDADEFIDNWHVDALCDHLQAVTEGKIKRLLINIPPGTAKSVITSVLYPVWVWTRDPKHKFLSTSFNIELATRDARKSRELIECEWFQKRWPIKLAADQNQKVNFLNTFGGFRTAKPFNSLTGSRGNTVLIDDPHSVKMGDSEVDRATTVNSFLTAVPSRVFSPKRDSIIVIMQRLHEEDVSGAILDRPELGYVHLCLPMEYEGDPHETCIGWRDPRTEDGELLFPQHFGPNEVQMLKSSLRTTYAGQYQQRPAPREAGEIDVRWFNRFNLGEHPEGCNFYMTSDHAPSGRGDYNVFSVWGIDAQRNLWLVDMFRKKCLMDEALGIERKNGGYSLLGKGALAMIRQWNPVAFYPEKDSTWLALESLFRSALRETETYVRIDPQTTSGLGDKVNKAQPFIAIASLGQVYIPNGTMGDTALDEMGRFPNAKHDDIVDSCAMIGRVVGKLRAGYNREPESKVIDFFEYADRREAGDRHFY